MKSSTFGVWTGDSDSLQKATTSHGPMSPKGRTNCLWTTWAFNIRSKASQESNKARAQQAPLFPAPRDCHRSLRPGTIPWPKLLRCSLRPSERYSRKASAAPVVTSTHQHIKQHQIPNSIALTRPPNTPSKPPCHALSGGCGESCHFAKRHCHAQNDQCRHTQPLRGMCEGSCPRRE